MDLDAAVRGILDSQRGRLAVCDREVVRGVVEPVSAPRFGFDCVIVSSVQFNDRSTVRAGGHGRDHALIHPADLESHVGKALRCPRRVHLDKLQLTDGGVIERELVCCAAVAAAHDRRGGRRGRRHRHRLRGAAARDRDGLRRRVENIAGDGLGLPRHDGRADRRSQRDASVGVGHILAVADGIPIAVRDEEGHARERSGGTVNVFLNYHCLIRIIVKGQGLRLAGTHHHGLRPVRADGVSVRAARLGGDDSAGHAGDSDLAVAVRPVDAVAGQLAICVVHITAVGVGEPELSARERRLSIRAGELADNERTLLRVPERERLHLARLDENVLRRSVQNESVDGLDLTHLDRCAGFEAAQNDLTGLVRIIDTIIGADCRAAAVHHAERNAGKRLILRTLNEIAIGNPPLLLALCEPAVRADFPPLRTVHATFTAHGAPSMQIICCMYVK